jgi:hypothetical protein
MAHGEAVIVFSCAEQNHLIACAVSMYFKIGKQKAYQYS